MANKEEVNKEVEEVKEELQEEKPEVIAEEVNEEVEEDMKKKKKVNKVEELQNKVIELTEKLEAAKNEYYKAYADTENMRKRLQSEFDQKNKYRIQSFALEILPALDNFERALANCNKEDPLYVGVDMVYQQLVNALKNEGVEEIEAKDQPFDPNVHNALMTEKVEGIEPNTVIEVLQKGYKLKDRVLRATLVKVSE